MSYKIAFFDIDGTLLDEDKQIPQDTIDAIREIQEQGVEAVIATGRAPYFSRILPRSLRSTPSSALTELMSFTTVFPYTIILFRAQMSRRLLSMPDFITIRSSLKAMTRFSPMRRRIRRCSTP